MSEVLRISTDQVAPTPPTVTGLGREYLTGLAKLGNRLLILLDVERLLTESVPLEAHKPSAVVA